MKYNDWTEEDWSTLIYTIKRKNCILMLGPEASTDQEYGQTRPLTEILANTLAERMKPWNIDLTNLAQVAQYYCMETGRNDLEANVYSFYDARQHLTSELHRNLASLPFYLIITSTPDKMLYKALQDEKKEPIVERYNFRGENLDMVQMGTVDKPLIFYLYGTIDEPESLVITEDDLLEFLITVISKKSLPNNIRSELQSKNKSLLFLGFGFKHWYLRILLHVLQGHSKESRSFALEQFSPRNINELERTILFYRRSDFRIQIYNKDLNSFVKELQIRFKECSSVETTTFKLQDAPTVFICHANENKQEASSLYEQLESAGFRAWIDKENLRGGDMWDRHIEKTIKKIDYFVVLQSKALLDKFEGYVNKEINLALDRQRYFRPGTRFIIPVKIDNSLLLEDLDYLQAIDLSDKDNIKELITTIKRDQQRRKK